MTDEKFDADTQTEGGSHHTSPARSVASIRKPPYTSADNSTLAVGDPEKQQVGEVIPVSSDEEPTRKIRGVKVCFPSENYISSTNKAQWFLVVSAVLSSCFLNALDTTIVAVIIPNLVRDLGSVERVPWMSLGFVIAGAALILPLAKMYSLLNIKWLYMTCLLLFTAGSALCGAAPTMNSEIGGRVIAGIGGCGMYLGSLTFLSVLTTGKERPTYLGLTGLVWGAGIVLGPLIGGGFHDSSAGWRWAFYINLIIVGVFLPVYIFLLPSINPSPNRTFKEKMREFDWLGATLICGGILTGIIAIALGGVDWEWDSAQSIALFVVSAVFFIAFGLVESFEILTTHEHKLFPTHFLKSRTQIICFITTAAACTATFIPINYIPLFFQFTRGDKAITAAVRLLPLIIILIVFTVGSGIGLTRFGLYKPFFIVGNILSLVAGICLYTLLDTDTTVGVINGLCIVAGAGAGLTLQNGYAVSQSSVPESDVPFAVGFILISQLGGGTIAISIAGTVFVNKAITRLSAVLPHLARHELEQAISGTGSGVIRSLTGVVRERAIDAIVDAIASTFVLVIAGSGLALIASLGLKWEKLKIQGGAAA